jgi:LysR family transcriptional activator of nhaA
MIDLNYHHLYYFWMIGREGSIARVCESLDVSQPTISAQLAQLEKKIGEKLFVRSGRDLVMTETGRLVFGYADRIFQAGDELQQALAGRADGPRERMLVGVADVLSKTLVYRLLEAVTRLDPPPVIICSEDKSERLVAELAQHNLDVVLTDSAPGPAVKARTHGHLLGESPIAFYAAKELATQLGGDFPKCLDGAPMLLPMRNTAMRRTLDDWFESNHIFPMIRGEFCDSALMKAFGQHACGVFPATRAVGDTITRQFGVVPIGVVDKLHASVYAITIDRTPKHRGVIALVEAARNVFGEAKCDPSGSPRAND